MIANWFERNAMPYEKLLSETGSTSSLHDSLSAYSIKTDLEGKIYFLYILLLYFFCGLSTNYERTQMKQTSLGRDDFVPATFSETLALETETLHRLRRMCNTVLFRIITAIGVTAGPAVLAPASDLHLQRQLLY